MAQICAGTHRLLARMTCHSCEASIGSVFLAARTSCGRTLYQEQVDNQAIDISSLWLYASFRKLLHILFVYVRYEGQAVAIREAIVLRNSQPSSQLEVLIKLKRLTCELVLLG